MTLCSLAHSRVTLAGRALTSMIQGKVQALTETVAGTGGHRLGRDAVLSPKASLVAFGLAPCPGPVLWRLWLQKALGPLPAVIPGGSVGLPKMQAHGPGESRFFFKLRT